MSIRGVWGLKSITIYVIKIIIPNAPNAPNTTPEIPNIISDGFGDEDEVGGNQSLHHIYKQYLGCHL